MKTLLKGGRIVDPSRSLDGSFDLLIENGVIARLDRGLPAEDATVIEVPAGCIVCPGFMDMHVHLREPGHEHKETIATGVAAAVAGGFTAVACMPNTDPVNDHAGVTEFILKRAAQSDQARVYPIGAVSLGSKGHQLAEIGELRAAGCVAISDDGRPVADALLMRRALEYAGMFSMPVIDHCEEPSLKGEGVAHEGYQASVLGLRGMPSEAEEIMVARDVTLGALTREAVHVAHISARGSLLAVRSGKHRGVRVTCEVTPHHFTLTDDALAGYATNCKMNPPLRDAADRDAMLQGLADGSIDAIATDHGPAPLRRKGRRIRPGAIRGRRVGNGRLDLSRSVGQCGVAFALAPGGAALGQSGQDPESARRHAGTGHRRRHHGSGTRSGRRRAGGPVPIQRAKHTFRRVATPRWRGCNHRGWPPVVHQRRCGWCRGLRSRVGSSR